MAFLESGQPNWIFIRIQSWRAEHWKLKRFLQLCKFQIQEPLEFKIDRKAFAKVNKKEARHYTVVNDHRGSWQEVGLPHGQDFLWRSRKAWDFLWRWSPGARECEVLELYYGCVELILTFFLFPPDPASVQVTRMDSTCPNVIRKKKMFFGIEWVFLRIYKTNLRTWQSICRKWFRGHNWGPLERPSSIRSSFARANVRFVLTGLILENDPLPLSNMCKKIGPESYLFTLGNGIRYSGQA